MHAYYFLTNTNTTFERSKMKNISSFQIAVNALNRAGLINVNNININDINMLHFTNVSYVQ